MTGTQGGKPGILEEGVLAVGYEADVGQSPLSGAWVVELDTFLTGLEDEAVAEHGYIGASPMASGFGLHPSIPRIDSFNSQFVTGIPSHHG